MKTLEIIFYVAVTVIIAYIAINYFCPKTREGFKKYSDYDCEPGDVCVGQHGGSGTCRNSGEECFMPTQNY